MSDSHFRWLRSLPNRFSTISHQEIVDHLYGLIDTWKRKNPRLEWIYEDQIVYSNCQKFFYDRIVEFPEDYDDYDDFTVKYTSSLMDLYFEIKDACESYTCTIMKELSSDVMIQFIYSQMEEIDEDEQMEIDEEEELMNDREY